MDKGIYFFSYYCLPYFNREAKKRNVVNLSRVFRGAVVSEHYVKERVCTLVAQYLQKELIPIW